MALTSSSDDGFREIQLNGKQLVFLFMAVTVVLVVTFLTGVLVGRGVRAERAVEPGVADIEEVPAAPAHEAIVPAQGNDPTRAVPTPGAEEPDSNAKAATAAVEEQPPVAVKRTSPADAPPSSTAAKTETPKADGGKAEAAKAVATPAKSAPAVAQVSASASAAPPATPPKPTAPPATPSTTAGGNATRDGYAVQVAAVNAQGEADSIANRLKAKGYSAYVENPKGSQKMFRVRVGTFKSRSEAVTVADKLKKEEKFKPWVTR